MKAIEETALSTRQETTGELATTSAAAIAQHEIQSAIIIARKFPRNEDQAFAKLMKSCQRTSFAEDAAYEFPRGDTKVKGPSVNIAREAARVWQNIRYGLHILRDDEDSRQICGWAWDMETNVRIEMEDDFAKLVYRKKGGWVRPDERDLRELTNRRGAILVRNCLLQLLPKDLIEDALEMCVATIKKGVEQDPDGARKKTIIAFGAINVTPEMLEKFLGHSLAVSTPAEITELRQIYASIRDGNSKWHEYVEAKESAAADVAGSNGNGKKSTETGTLNMDDLKVPTESAAQDGPAGRVSPDLTKSTPPAAELATIDGSTADRLEALFRDALKPALRKNATALLKDWLKSQSIVNPAGYGDPMAVRLDSYNDVKEGAVTHARSL